MADSEYTDDETEYDSPSDSQALLVVRLHLRLRAIASTNKRVGRAPDAIPRPDIQDRTPHIPQRPPPHRRHSTATGYLRCRVWNILPQVHSDCRSRSRSASSVRVGSRAPTACAATDPVVIGMVIRGELPPLTPNSCPHNHTMSPWRSICRAHLPTSTWVTS